MKVEIDDGVYYHRKVVGAGRDARDLWLAAIFYCARNLTDGYVPAGVLHSIDPGVSMSRRKAISLAEKLVDVGLFERAEGGYLVHDYLDHQPSKAEIEERREQAAERQRRRRAGPHVTPSVTRDNGVTSRAGASAGPHAGAPEADDDDDLRTPEQSSSSVHQHLPAAAAALKPSRSQIDRWATAAGDEPERFAACLSSALERGTRPAAYLDALVSRGEWPQPTTLLNGAGPRRTGWRWVRGSHGGTYRQDPEGKDQPPAEFLATVRGDE